MQLRRPHSHIYNFNKLPWETIIGIPRHTNSVQVLNDKNLKTLSDLHKVINDKSKRMIILEGFFQKASLLSNYQHRIHKWCPLTQHTQDENALAIHLRLADYDSAWRPHPQYYIDCIHQSKPSRVVLFYNGGKSVRDKEYLKVFHILYNKNFPSLELETAAQSEPFSDMCLMASFHKIVTCQSTFSWCASFLSTNAEQIFMPNTVPGKGLWGEDWALDLVDLHVKDSKYHYVDCKWLNG
ncbi:MAG: hypothetical protein ACXADH_04120 [Candidatus Kariarchaeaceae archaeon]|jgi:hypothetical protein